MPNRLARPKLIAAIAATIALHGCGGNSSSGSAPPPTASYTFTGTAATGGALASAVVDVRNTAKNSPCKEVTITTDPLGSYTCTLKAGEVAPFFIKVTDPTGNTAPLVSIATSTPVAGTPLLVNATPLTTAIVAQLNGGDALGVFDKAELNVSQRDSFEAIKANVIAQIQAIVSALDPTLKNYDPFTTSITAATAGTTGNTADRVLDVIKVTKTASGALALSTIADATPIPLATATSTGKALPAPPTEVKDLAQAVALIGQAFKSCYALEPKQRVTLDAKQSITEILPTCQKVTDTGAAQTGLPTFKHNGYNAAQAFYNMLTDSHMTGAKFSAPEIMAFYPADDSHPRARAVLNIRFIDNLGYAKNRITIAQNKPGSSSTSHPSNWWVTGNQWNYDLSIAPQIWRNQNVYQTPHGNFQNGLAIHINGANMGNASAPNSDRYDSALVTGNGLPTNGLWYVRTSNSGLFTMSAVRKAPPQSTANLSQALVCSSCSSFWMARTTGLVGAAATTLAPNPTDAPPKLQWGSASDGSYNEVSGTRPTKGAAYVFKIYKDGTLVTTETRTLLNDLVPATQIVNVPWNGIGPNTTSALDITNTALNGTQTSLAIDWTQNPSAEQIQYIWVSQTDGGYDNATTILPGATSVIATPQTGDGTTTTFTSMVAKFSDSQAPYGGYRHVGFQYRMLDSSVKNAVYFYEPY